MFFIQIEYDNKIIFFNIEINYKKSFIYNFITKSYLTENKIKKDDDIELDYVATNIPFFEYEEDAKNIINYLFNDNNKITILKHFRNEFSEIYISDLTIENFKIKKVEKYKKIYVVNTNNLEINSNDIPEIINYTNFLDQKFLRKNYISESLNEAEIFQIQHKINVLYSNQFLIDLIDPTVLENILIKKSFLNKSSLKKLNLLIKNQSLKRLELT